MAERQAGPAPGERLPREHTLRRSADYLRCYRRGRRLRGSYARLHFAPNEEGHPRLGITASRKVGKAVVRNRLKRRVREVFRRYPGREELPAVDLVVHVEPAAADAAFSALAGELEGMLGRLAGGGDR
jgi:ribonuclease P protein component